MLHRNMSTADCQKSGVEGKRLGLHSALFSGVAMETHDLTTKMMVKIAKIARNCESWANANTVHLRNYRVFCLAGGQNIAMARTLASLPTGSRVTDYISLGVVSRSIPREKIDSILAATGKASVRQRELPAHLVVYYVIALALYMQSSYREVLRCLLE